MTQNIGVFVMRAFRTGDPPKAYATAPVRLTATTAVVLGPGTVEWSRTPVQFTSWKQRRYRAHEGGGWSRIPRMGIHGGWCLLRVEEVAA